MEITEIFKFWGLGGVIAFATVWLIREIFKQILSKDVEKFKNDLELKSIEFKIKYEKLHTERAEVIKEIYKKISKTFQSMHSYVNIAQWSGEPNQEQKAKNAAEMANDLVSYYEENKIFFEEEVDFEIDKLMKEFKEVWLTYSLSKSLKPHSDESMKEWDKAWKKINEDVPNVKKIIENKFRKIIGIN